MRRPICRHRRRPAGTENAGPEWSTRQRPVPNRTPIVVSTTLTANSAITHSTSVSLTAVPTPLAPPDDRETAVAAHQPGDQAEDGGLDDRDQHLGKAGDQRQRRDVGAGRDVLQIHTEDEAADQADGDHRTVEQQRDEGRGDHAGHDEPVDRVDAEHLERVDLLTDGAGAEVGADGRRPGACHHEHCHQRAQLGDGADRRARAGDVGGAELGEQDVQQ